MPRDIEWWPWEEDQPIPFVLADTSGPIDLTVARLVGCRLAMDEPYGVEATVGGASGVVTIPAQPPGRYEFEFEVVWPDGMHQAFPTFRQHLVVHPVTQPARAAR